MLLHFQFCILEIFLNLTWRSSNVILSGEVINWIVANFKHKFDSRRRLSVADLIVFQLITFYRKIDKTDARAVEIRENNGDKLAGAYLSRNKSCRCFIRSVPFDFNLPSINRVFVDYYEILVERKNRIAACKFIWNICYKLKNNKRTSDPFICERTGCIESF